ncbi:MAG TPA: substrate-binding domain-containing protein, partial [Treponemataceae bacterium]|nr:substrate-binding domain-containing protein [Treponemataceae bacterium]
DGTANAYTITVTRNPLITVGVILPLNTGDRWPKDIAGFNANATDTGTKINLALSDGTTATQLADFNAMVSSGIKFILFTPVDRTDACWETALQTAHTAGITVIAYDRYIKGADLFFSFDNTEIGRMQSKWLTGKVPTGQYYVLSGDPADDNAALYKAGALEIINGHIGIAYDTGEVTGWSHDKAKQLVADYLVGHTPSAILTPNDGTAGSAALAIDASTLSVSNKAGLCAVLTGQDGELAAFQRIYKGKQGMTIVKNIDYLTKWALSICSDMASGKTVSTLANGTYQGTPSFLLTYGIDPKAVFLVDGSNLESLAKEGTLGSTWNEISGQ